MSVPSVLLATAPAAADTARPVVHFIDRMVPGMHVTDMPAFIEKWHDFFLLSGTAAVTLVGLLFLSLSFNLEVLLHDSKAHLLEHARSIMISYTFVLVLSLAFLVPQSSFQFAALMLVAFSLVALGLQVARAFRRGRPRPPAHENFLRRRYGLLIVGYVLALTNGLQMLFNPHPTQVFNMVGLVCLLLGNAVGSSWDLLVRVAKQRQDENLAAPPEATTAASPPTPAGP